MFYNHTAAVVATTTPVDPSFGKAAASAAEAVPEAEPMAVTDRWDCVACTFSNKSSKDLVQKCAHCETPALLPFVDLRVDVAPTTTIRASTTHDSPDAKMFHMRDSNNTITCISDLRQPSQILSSLFVSDVRSATDIPTLQRLGVTHIVSIATQPVDFTAVQQRLFMDVTHVRVPNTEDYPLIMAHATHVTRFIEAAVRSGGRVLVHCTSGQNCSAALVAAYLMTRADSPFTMLEAMQCVCDARRAVLTNDRFVRQLIDLAVHGGVHG
jgi:protein-tyrosine phosphatase